LTTWDLLVDIYSNWVDDRDVNNTDYAPLAFRRSGGAQIAAGLNAGTDLFLRNDLGWRLVPANYAHEWKIDGNLWAEDNNLPIFDLAPLNVLGAYPAIYRASNLLTRTIVSGSGVTPADVTAIAEAVVDESVEGSLTVAQAMRLILSVLTNNATIPNGVGSFTFKDVASTKNRITGTLDASGNRIITTVDPT
jgi:hypothetical protein